MYVHVHVHVHVHVLREPISGDFIWINVVKMLSYLADQTCPDITYAVNFATRYVLPKACAQTCSQVNWSLSESSC